ncbi:MAG: hypothetical protein RR588_14250, partial [Solibacillus sp.]
GNETHLPFPHACYTQFVSEGFFYFGILYGFTRLEVNSVKPTRGQLLFSNNMRNNLLQADGCDELRLTSIARSKKSGRNYAKAQLINK